MRNQVGRAKPRAGKTSPATKKDGRKPQPTEQVGGGQTTKHKAQSKPVQKPLREKCNVVKRGPIKKKNIKQITYDI